MAQGGSDNQYGSEEARAQEEWRENIRLRRMLGNANLSKEQVRRGEEADLCLRPFNLSNGYRILFYFPSLDAFHA